MRTIYIYGLWDPRDGRLRYIGKTVNTRTRLASHIRETKKKGPTTHLRSWITGILQENEIPMLEILEETTEVDWKEIEHDWIRQCRDFGIDLVNLADGGLGGGTRGRKMSEAHKQKIRDRWADPEWRARTMEARKNAVKKITGHGGVLWTPEGLASFKEKRKTWKPRLGMTNTPEQNAKIGAANAIALAGREIPEEVRMKGTEVRWSTPGERERWAEVAKKRPRNNKGQFLPKEGA